MAWYQHKSGTTSSTCFILYFTKLYNLTMVQLKKSVLIYFRIGLRTNYIYLQFYRFETLGLHILHFGVVCLVIGCMQIFPLSGLTKTFLQKSEHQEIFFGPKLKILVRRLYFLSNKIIFCDLKWHSFQTGFMDSG